jgi:hypothetical protein
MLLEEEWLSKYCQRLTLESSLTGGGKKQGGSNQAKPKGSGCSDKEDPVVNLTSEGTPRPKERCRNCGIYSHLKQDCKRPNLEQKKEAHHVKAELKRKCAFVPFL